MPRVETRTSMENATNYSISVCSHIQPCGVKKNREADPLTRPAADQVGAFVSLTVATCITFELQDQCTAGLIQAMHGVLTRPVVNDSLQSRALNLHWYRRQQRA